jgi:hypothetical protein
MIHGIQHLKTEMYTQNSEVCIENHVLICLNPFGSFFISVFMKRYLNENNFVLNYLDLKRSLLDCNAM